MIFPLEYCLKLYLVGTISVPKEFRSTLCRTYRTFCILVRQPITGVKSEWNVAADVREIVLFP